MQSSPELGTIVTAWFAAWEHPPIGGSSWADRYLSHRMELTTVGTDPGEWFEGEEAFQHMNAEMNESAGLKFLPGDIRTHEEGSVGWAIARPMLLLPNGRQVAMRWSAVFHREDRDWKLVLFHASVGVPNEQLLE
jgi:SnoaL-like protein